MSYLCPTNEEKEKLQKFYIASRELLVSGMIPPICVQRSFEEAMSGFQNEYVWKPTHITPAAVKEIAEGRYKNVQRAHGVFGDRLGRFERTLCVLQSTVQDFDDWWRFYVQHDATVLVTRTEHGLGKKFDKDELISVPEEPKDMFARGGFSFKLRKKIESAWIEKIYQERNL